MATAIEKMGKGAADAVSVPYEEYKAPAKKYYWVGVLPGAPMQNISVPDATFHGFIGKRGINPNDGSVSMTNHMGSVVEWDEDRLERVKKQLNYERIEVTKGHKVLEDQEGHRYKMPFEMGKVRTLKDAQGMDNKFLSHTEGLKTSKPLSAYVYIVPVGGPSEWPVMEDFIVAEKVVEGEGTVWGNLEQFKLDKLPQPVGHPGKVG